MPICFAVLIVLVVILCAVAILECLDDCPAPIDKAAAIKQEAEDAAARMHASYNQALRDLHGHR